MLLTRSVFALLVSIIIVVVIVFLAPGGKCGRRGRFSFHSITRKEVDQIILFVNAGFPRLGKDLKWKRKIDIISNSISSPT